jgi:hypothetical protein
MAQNIPDRIERELHGTLKQLRQIASIIAETREQLDGRLGGRGRYEADAWRNRAADISRGIAWVETFREIAASKDIDAEAAILRLGGMPDFQISDAAKSWMED